MGAPWSDRDFGSGERRAHGGRIRSAACERGGESLFIEPPGGESPERGARSYPVAPTA